MLFYVNLNKIFKDSKIQNHVKKDLPLEQVPSKNFNMSRRCLILYASQTGYCIETADRIKREARQRHFQVEMISMDQYQLSKLPSESLIAFVCSVTGQGIEPDSMKVNFYFKTHFFQIFWRFLLRKDLPTDSLKNLSFGVFGQGDSSYAK